MAYNFSANQFDSVYKPKGLNNWELPKWYPPRPRQRKGSTKIIANDRGHLLDAIKKNDQNPWGNFRNTYQLPDKINRKFVENYNKCLLKKDKWSNFPQDANNCDIDNNNDFGISGKGLTCPSKCETTKQILSFDTNRNKRLRSGGNKEPLDLEYIPGDFTDYKQQHPTRDFLLEDKYKRDRNIDTDLKLNKNYLGEHECKLGECEPPPIKLTPLLPQTSALVTSDLSPKLKDLDLSEKYNFETNDDYLNKDTNKMFGSHSITEKPNERCPSPVVPAYANFELAKRMHSNNLDHQPLPDCVADLAFRKLQITGANPGLALDIEPIATGVGVKTHNAGPTHCTKMKVYRPKTSGVVPRAFNGINTRSYSATPADKKMGAMDLAICWDYKPPYEPARPKHIDGSNDSAGPAVFTYVKTPRDDAALSNTGRSAGVFTNTLGETGFFDKDILRRKTDFAGRKIATDDFTADIDNCPTFPRARSVSRDSSACHRLPQTRFSKQYKSTPDIMADHEYKSLRQKYLGADCEFPMTTGETGCKRSGFLRKARSRLCHKIAPEMDFCTRTCPPQRMTCSKTAFRAGVPRYNAAGNFISSDSGCSMGSNHSQRVLVVPRPRNPYSKRNYDIDTLVPPFRSYAGGAGEGGYPEHWRLASVYQHAYKPLECRRKPLLQTVYK
ncbi:UPF0740 protein [Lucilia cuprina]|uniref:Cilia- and flagella-associated protein 126 n=1 Tax=Lucilia cuprina TaxID=7375 RepID=A0A0L0CAJ3_LUCCU|nr:Protein Flattop like protein [Lucilia cuprina]KNC28464.1 UPF0740 protein [Lucilia cuprina]